MCCGNKQRRRGLLATRIYLAVQKIEQRRQQRTIQTQTTEGTKSFEAPIIAIQSTIPAENPPPYVEKEIVLQRDLNVVGAKSGAVERSISTVDRKERPTVDAYAVGK